MGWGTHQPSVNHLVTRHQGTGREPLLLSPGFSLAQGCLLAGCDLVWNCLPGRWPRTRSGPQQLCALGELLSWLVTFSATCGALGP